MPPIAGRYFAQNIPKCHATFYPDEGHSLLYKHIREIFSALLQADAAVPLVASQAALG